MKTQKKNKLFKNKRKMQNDDSLVTMHTRMPPSCFLPPEEFWGRNYYVHKDPIELSVIKK